MRFLTAPHQTWRLAPSSLVTLLAFSALIGISPRCLHATDFPTPFNSQDDANAVATPPEEALRALQLPPGFEATLFACEPDVQNPIAMTWDARGRLWIAENFTYAEGKTRFDLTLRDRVLIFEDTDGDGRFDKRTVFTDLPQFLTSVEVGHGGVWLMTPPQLIFIPDANGDDIPDGPPQVVLDGFTISEANYHNLANGLRWGPDGWLYGRSGHSCPGDIGRPGTPMDQRVRIHGGIWRYHPIRKTVEVLATGTTNPWGHDWDALGEGFFVNTVNGHFWHLIPGSHLSQGNSGRDPNPRAYELIDHHADHWHFDIGQHWSKSRDGAANELGGGHAHSGAMFYLGTNWPEPFRGRFFTINLHGRRLNQERVERSGSGFIARHAEDILISQDPWFRGIDLSVGPDGGVYLLDWSDTGECHERNGVHRTSGRIFKVTFGTPATKGPFDLRELTDAELIELIKSGEEWHVRQAKLILSERHRAGTLSPDAASSLKGILQSDASTVQQVRALLTLSMIGDASDEILLPLLQHPHEAVRAWSIRLLTDDLPLDTPLGPLQFTPEETARIQDRARKLAPVFVELAKKDSSGLVRLVLASTLQRLPVSERPLLAQALVSRVEDAEDHNLPLLVWYGLIPVADVAPDSILPVAAACKWPTTRRLIARRLAEEIEKNPAPLSKLLTFTSTQKEDYILDVLNGISEALRGWRKATPPTTWGAMQPVLETTTNEQIVQRIQELNVVFGDGRAMEELTALVLDPKVPLEARTSALTQLIESRSPRLRKLCEQLLSDRDLAPIAAGGLSLFDEPEVAELLIKTYNRLRPEQRPQLISILVTRVSFANALLQAVMTGTIPRNDLTAYHVRQLHSLGDDAIRQKVTEHWGQLRDSPEEKKQQMEKLKTFLSAETLQKADLSRGRLLYQKACAKCHKLYGEGQPVGPDLTGSNRFNLDYLIENIVDPSAAVNKDYRMTIFALNDGRVLNGLIVETTERTVTIQSLTERITIEKSEIDEMKETNLSPMPEGQLETLTPDEIRDLFAYLQSTSQVPLPAGASTENSPAP
jgi:putative membrane-bound dehydrogenase-like protein